MVRRTRTALLISLLVVAAVGAILFLQQKTPPQAARLLPECDAIVYANLKPIRLATHFDTKPVQHSPEYQQFLDATGILFERDLDSVAFALTRMADPTGPNGPVAFSEIFLGRFDGKRLTRYLEGIATARETYAGHEIYTIPVDLPAGPASHIVPTGRYLRVTQVSVDTIAASNDPTPEQIHAMLDRARSSFNPFGGPTLLAGLYPEVPLLSPVWGIGSIGLPFSEARHVSVFGIHLPFPDNTPFVASVRYTAGLHLRIEQIALSDDAAERSSQRLNTLLSLFRQMQQFQSFGGKDEALRQVIESLKIEQHQNRTILTAAVPLDLLRTLSSPVTAPDSSAPSSAPGASK